MAWMETDYSKHTYFRWKIKWRLVHLGALGIMGETALKLHGEVRLQQAPSFMYKHFARLRCASETMFDLLDRSNSSVIW